MKLSLAALSVLVPTHFCGPTGPVSSQANGRVAVKIDVMKPLRSVGHLLPISDASVSQPMGKCLKRQPIGG